jgi:CRISPR-associated protein Cmr5
MNRIESLIPQVLTVLKDEFKDNKIPKEYNGYISSFGASVMMSGLKSTIAMFENQNAHTQEDRVKLMRIIFRVLTNNQTGKLLDYVIENESNILKKEILDIATAIKLSIRTFKLE